MSPDDLPAHESTSELLGPRMPHVTEQVIEECDYRTALTLFIPRQPLLITLEPTARLLVTYAQPSLYF